MSRTTPVASGMLAENRRRADYFDGGATGWVGWPTGSKQDGGVDQQRRRTKQSRSERQRRGGERKCARYGDSSCRKDDTVVGGQKPELKHGLPEKKNHLWATSPPSRHRFRIAYL